MGNKVKKSLDDIRKDVQPLDKNHLDKIFGGKGKSTSKYNLGCDGLVPQ